MKNGPALDFELGRSISAGRFVLLRHSFPSGDARKSHWDLMLEQSENLFTLQLLALPSPDSPHLQKIQAMRLPDHRPIYLEYEGPISGNRGSVHRAAQGSYQISSTVAGTGSSELDDESKIERAITIRLTGSIALAEPASLVVAAKPLVAQFQLSIPGVNAPTELTFDEWQC